MTSEAPTAAARSETPDSVDRRFEIEPHNCFACGSLNAGGLRLDLHLGAAGCWSRLSLPGRFQGWDGIAHGGVVATILDEVMAWSLVGHDNWGLTARLAVDFKRPVPLEAPILAEGWVTATRRRLITTAGRISDGAGLTLATAEATYLAAPEERRRELRERYGFRLVPEGGAR